MSVVGLGLNLRVWIMLGSRLHTEFHLEVGRYVLLTGVPLLMAMVLRIPVGVLTDRFGPRLMFPAVSLIAAASAFGLAVADSLPMMIVAGAFAGVAGTAFVVSAAAVCEAFPYGRRGVALGLVGVAPVLAVLVSGMSWSFDPGGRRAAIVLGCLLVGFTSPAAIVFRGGRSERHGGSSIRRSLTMARLGVSTSLSVLYALALGSVVAVAVYLPVYLSAAFDLAWFHALAVTGTLVALAALARVVGGWWADHCPTPRLLMVCYTVGAAACLVEATQPRLWWLTVVVIATVAVCDGLAAGALLALIGKAARPGSVGAIMGVTGAAAAFGALVPPLLLIGADLVTHSHSAAWLLVAATLVGVALYVRANNLRIGLGLSVPLEPAPGPTAMTVAVVAEADTRWGAAAVVARLAELAINDELVVVYGCDAPPRPEPGPNILVTGLRHRLPRHSVKGLRLARPVSTPEALAELFGDLVDAGAIAVAITPTAVQSGLAAEVSSYLHADRVLKVTYTLAAGADLHEVWTRRAITGG
jgi:NNP family nitrate/nitrite transporter-like MFS transporter